MKNRFRMYKGPTCTDEEFAKMFEGLEFGGISFCGDTTVSGKEVERTFCSCGYCGDSLVSTCPNCGKTITNLNRSSYGSYDTIQTGRSYGALVEDPDDSDLLALFTTSIKVKMTRAEKWFDVEVQRNKSAVFHKDDNLRVEVLAEGVPDFSILVSSMENFKNTYPERAFVFTDYCSNDCSAFVKLMKMAYALPEVYNNDNYRMHAKVLTRIGLRTASKLNDKGEYVIPTLVPSLESYLSKHPIDSQGAPAEKSMGIKDFLWIYGIPPQVEDTQTFSEQVIGYDLYSLAESDLSTVQKLASIRDFFDTPHGGWWAHLLNNGRISARNIGGWASSFMNMNADMADLFYAWMRDRIDVIELRFPSDVYSSFMKDCDFLKSCNMVVDENNLREKRINALRNEGRHELEEYIDVMEGLKNPTDLIIRMAAAKKEEASA